MTIGESHEASAATDSAADARWRDAAVRAAEVQAKPGRPAMTRIAVAGGAACILFALVAAVIRVDAAASPELARSIGVLRTIGLSAMLAMSVVALWAVARMWGLRSPLEPLTRRERSVVRAALVDREVVDDRVLAVVSGVARQRRMSFVALMAAMGFWAVGPITWSQDEELLSLLYVAAVSVAAIVATVLVLRQRPISPPSS